MDYHLTIPEQAPNVPRIGLKFSLSPEFKYIEWYGRGPHENYPDRKSGAAIGIYRSTLNNFITPYVRPQENANRCDIRWIQFSGDDQRSLRFEATAGDQFSASAWPYTQKSLEQATHDFKLSKEQLITVNIDCTQMGVGGDNSWGLPVNEPYLLKPGTYRYKFRITAK